MFQPTDLRKNKLYVMVYLVFLNFIVQILVPFTTLIVVNYRTYLTIKESEQNLASGNFSIQFKSSSRFRYESIVPIPKVFFPFQLTYYCRRTNTTTTTTTDNRGDGIKQRSLQLRRKSSAVSCSKLPSSSTNKATSLRRREVVLSRISIYIVFVFLFCHSIRIIPNLYEMVSRCLPAVSSAAFELCCTLCTIAHLALFAVFIWQRQNSSFIRPTRFYKSRLPAACMVCPLNTDPDHVM